MTALAAIEIRKFTPADLDNLYRMIYETIEASYPSVYPPRAVAYFRRHHAKKRILERSQVGEILVLVFPPQGLIVATGSLVGAEIAGVFVRPECQRQGYGKTVMRHLEDAALAKGIAKVHLNISLPSRGFYERLGYEVVEERILRVGQGQYLRYWLGEKSLIL